LRKLMKFIVITEEVYDRNTCEICVSCEKESHNKMLNPKQAKICHHCGMEVGTNPASSCPGYCVPPAT